jgi:predicted nuclease of predicted toxin-antitoxin system
VRLIFDANMSRHLIAHLNDVYPGSEHASVLGPVPDDIEIWDYAKANGLVVVTKDSDFYRMSVGCPAEGRVAQDWQWWHKGRRKRAARPGD